MFHFTRAGLPAELLDLIFFTVSEQENDVYELNTYVTNR